MALQPRSHAGQNMRVVTSSCAFNRSVKHIFLLPLHRPLPYLQKS